MGCVVTILAKASPMTLLSFLWSPRAAHTVHLISTEMREPHTDSRSDVFRYFERMRRVLHTAILQGMMLMVVVTVICE
jgi:hypothetical protein